MPTIRRFAVALLVGAGIGYVVYPPPEKTEEATITAGQLLCEAISAKPKILRPILQSADEILAFVADVYSNCETYRDGGRIESLVTYEGGDHVSRSSAFRMVFRRPDRLRIQFNEPGGINILCNEQGVALSCRTHVDRRGTEPSFGAVMLGASIVSDGLVDWINALLMPDVVESNPWSLLAGMTLDFVEDDCDGNQYVIHGCVGNDSVLLRIDEQTFLPNTIEISSSQSEFHVTRTLILSPELDSIIPDREFRFTEGDKVQYSKKTGAAYGGTQIIGSVQFATRLYESFEMLNHNDRESLRLVLEHLASIEQDGPFGVFPVTGHPFVGLPAEAANFDPAVCAGLLVFYAQQSKLYSEYRERYGQTPPEDIWMSEDSLKQCGDRVATALKSFANAKYNIQHLIESVLTLANAGIRRLDQSPAFKKTN